MEQIGMSESANTIPLCVDLDGTLVQTDLLLESIFALLKQSILNFLLLPLWPIKGKAHFKQKIADRMDLDVSLLPYNKAFLDYTKQQYKSGRRLTLATAT